MEVWKDIKGYEGYYQVSSEGRIKSLDRIVISRNRWGFHNRHYKGRLLKFELNKDGYFYCGLCKDSRRIMYIVHRLVAEAFINNPECKSEVNHIDGNKQNSRVNNFEWMTHEENMDDAVKNGLLNNKGKNHPRARIIFQMDKLGNIIKKFNYIKEAERELGICSSSICNVCKGKLKIAGGFRWCYG